MTELSSDRYFRYLLHTWSRRVLVMVVGIWVAWLLTGRGWPWWAWLPAVVLAVQGAYALLIFALYAYHKATYQRRAELIRQRLREVDNQTDNEDQAHPSSLTN